MSDPILWWHGGPAGLNEILPPSVTGVKAARDYLDDEAVVAHMRTDQVYCTDSAAWAAIYAVMSSKTSAVYVVTPHLPMLPDPDLVTHGIQSVMCPMASVIHAYVMTPADRRFWGAQALLAVQRHGISLESRGVERLLVDDALRDMLSARA